MSEPKIDDPTPTPPKPVEMEINKFYNQSISEKKNLYVTLTHNGNVVGLFIGKNMMY